jgi:ketosteroid isomerase-like protein
MTSVRMNPPHRSTSRRVTIAFFIVALMAAVPAAGAQGAAAVAVTKSPTDHGSDSSAAVAVVERLHTLLEEGDSAAVLELLTPDVVILESGGFEDRAEFRAHHLPADIEFARAVRSIRTLRSVRVDDGVAWVASTSVTQGEFRGRAINSAGAELIVLRRIGDSWRIAAIHWSSRARRS